MSGKIERLDYKGPMAHLEGEPSSKVSAHQSKPVLEKCVGRDIEIGLDRHHNNRITKHPHSIINPDENLRTDRAING